MEEVDEDEDDEDKKDSKKKKKKIKVWCPCCSLWYYCALVYDRTCVH